MELTITISDQLRLAGLSRALAAYNASNPALTEAQFVQKMIEGQLDSVAKSYVKASITKLEFLDRFQVQERVAIREAALTNGVVKDYLELLNAATEVNLTSERTMTGVAALEALGLIGQGRAQAILAI